MYTSWMKLSNIPFLLYFGVQAVLLASWEWLIFGSCHAPIIDRTVYAWGGVLYFLKFVGFVGPILLVYLAWDDFEDLQNGNVFWPAIAIFITILLLMWYITNCVDPNAPPIDFNYGGEPDYLRPMHEAISKIKNTIFWVIGFLAIAGVCIWAWRER